MSFTSPAIISMCISKDALERDDIVPRYRDKHGEDDAQAATAHLTKQGAGSAQRCCFRKQGRSTRGGAERLCVGGKLRTLLYSSRWVHRTNVCFSILVTELPRYTACWRKRGLLLPLNLLLSHPPLVFSIHKSEARYPAVLCLLIWLL